MCYERDTLSKDLPIALRSRRCIHKLFVLWSRWETVSWLDKLYSSQIQSRFCTCLLRKLCNCPHQAL